MTTRSDVAHLLRRATFGPRADEVDAAERAGPDATLAALLSPSTVDAGAARTPAPAVVPDPVAALPRDASPDQRSEAQAQRRVLSNTLSMWWLDRLVVAEHQAREKLTFFWHGHWATSIRKVAFTSVMQAQQQTFYALGTGDFGALVRAMVHDPALVYWLDGHKNTAKAPNENLARELMELFTLGIGNYTESDVKEGARALTGWAVDRGRGVVALNANRFDPGDKTILGRTGPFGADEFVDLLLAQEACARFVTGRLWFRFASGEPVPAGAAQRLVAAFAPARDITAAMRALLTDPDFADTRGHLAKQPIEWMVGAMRQLGVRPAELRRDDQGKLLQSLRRMGQIFLDPPSVGGWPAGAAWLSTSAAQLRLRTADVLAALASPVVLDRIAAVPAPQRADAVAHLLVVDEFTARTREVLDDAAGEPRRLLALALSSPEYVVC